MNRAHLYAFDRQLLKIFHLHYLAVKKMSRHPIEVVCIENLDGIQDDVLINKLAP